MVNLVNGVEQSLRNEMAIKERAQRFVDHYLKVNREVNRLIMKEENDDSSEDTDDAKDDEKAEGVETPCDKTLDKATTTPCKNVVKKMVLVQPRGEEERMNDDFLPSYKNDIFARDQFGDEYDSAYDIFRGSQENQQAETLENAKRALKEAMANGSVHAFEYMSVRFGLFAPTIKGDCVNCGNPMPSFEECMPVPHGRYTDCHKHMCWTCIKERNRAAAYECKTCLEQHSRYQAGTKK
jgi:hypothetical protein